MITLSNPVKAFLLVFAIAVSIDDYGLEKTILTMVVIMIGIVFYNLWVKEPKI